MKIIKLILMAVICMMLPMGSINSMRGPGRSNAKKKTAPRHSARTQVAPRGAQKPSGVARIQNPAQQALKPLDGNLDALVADFTQEEYELNFGNAQRLDGAEAHDNNAPGDQVVGDNDENLDAFMADLTPEEYELNYGHKRGIEHGLPPQENGLEKVIEPVMPMAQDEAAIDRSLASAELFSRVQNGDADIAGLLERGADINTSQRGLTPLLQAVIGGDELLCAALLKHGADITIPLHGDYSIEYLSGDGLRFKNFWTLTLHNRDQGPPSLSALHIAAGFGLVGVTALLIEAGADCNAMTPDGWTPLLLTSLLLRMQVITDRSYMINCIIHLVVGGADVNSCALMTKNPINFWGDVHEVAGLWLTPLLNALATNDVIIYTYLLKKGAQVNIHNNMARAQGRIIPLIEAAQRYGIPACHALLRHGADARNKNSDGQSLWVMALSSGQSALYEELIHEAQFLPTEEEVVASFSRIKATLLTFNHLASVAGIQKISRDIRHMIVLKTGLRNDIMIVMFDRARKGKAIPKLFAGLILGWLVDYKIEQLQKGMEPVYLDIMKSKLMELTQGSDYVSPYEARLLGILDPAALRANYGDAITLGVVQRFGSHEAPKPGEEPKPES